MKPRMNTGMKIAKGGERRRKEGKGGEMRGKEGKGGSRKRGHR